MKKTPSHYHFLLLLGMLMLLSYTHLPAQNEKIIFEYYGVNEGLPETSIQALLQDRQGFIWVGTQNGVHWYDGHEFVRYLDGYNLYIYEDRKGEIWIGGDDFQQNTLSKIDPETGSLISYVSSSYLSGDSNWPSYIVADVHSYLWLITEDGMVQRFDPKKEEFRSYPLRSFSPYRLGHFATVHYVSLAEDQEGEIWIGVPGEGVYQYEAERDSFLLALSHLQENKNSLLTNAVTVLETDTSGLLWIGSDKGISVYDKQTHSFQHFTPEEDTPLSNAFKLDLHQKLWLISLNSCSLSYIETATRTVHTFAEQELPIPAELSYQTLIPFAFNEDIIWFFLYSGKQLLRSKVSEGFLSYQYKTGKFSFFDDQFNHLGNTRNVAFSQALLDDQGLLWIGNMWGGLQKEDPRRQLVDLFQHDPMDLGSLPSDTITAILQDGQERIWIGSNRALSRYDPIEKRFINYRSSPVNSRGLMEDQSGNLWIGTNNGLSFFNIQTEQFTQFLKDEKSPNDVRFLMEDQDGRLWLSLWGKGVGVFNQKTGVFDEFFKSIPKDTSTLLESHIRKIFQDSRGDIWFSFYSPGICKFLPGSRSFQQYRPVNIDFKSITDYKSITYSDIMNIQEDSRGCVWFLSNGFGASRNIRML